MYKLKQFSMGPFQSRRIPYPLIFDATTTNELIGVGDHKKKHNLKGSRQLTGVSK